MTEPKVARLVVTLNCDRHCTYCCNKQAHNSKAIHNAPKVRPSDLGEYDEICVSGGEPTQYLKHLVYVLERLPDKPKKYLYTAHRAPWPVLDLLDGITYTIHKEQRDLDNANLMLLQCNLGSMPGFSSRLKIHRGCVSAASIVPRVWDKISFWEPTSLCQWPVHEDLFRLDVPLDTWGDY